MGTDTIRSYEITSYGDSYLSGVLASSASKTGKIGIIAGMKNGLFDIFIDGYTDWAMAANGTIAIDREYVQRRPQDSSIPRVRAGSRAECSATGLM